ncbi:MAG: glycosyltransferase family 4 protein [Rhodoferax sp.]|nr:glycosyltransferase family 4 protein [Rhodoferax sp.]
MQNVQSWLLQTGRACRIVTPFQSPTWQFYLMLFVRRPLTFISPATGVWWYRWGHGFFLEHVLDGLLADGAPCIIYAQCPVSAAAALRARKSPSQVVVAAVHFNGSQATEWSEKGAISPGGWLFRAIKKMESQVLPALDGLVYVSEFMSRVIQDRIAACMEVPSRVIPNFKQSEVSPASEVARKGLITVGTLEPRKNQRYALEIIFQSKVLGQPLCLTVVGDGPDRTELENLVSTWGIGSQVRFTGFIANASDLMPSHQAYLHVAKMESFGIVLIEAMSHGLPVFAAPVGGISEVFSNDVEGLQIPLDDARAAAIAILGWINDADQMHRASAAARCAFLEKYEASKVGTRLTAFLDEIASR